MKYQVLTGVLHFSSALHIGSGKNSNLSDALLRRDVSGQVFIPGTSLAGALRGLAIKLAPRLGLAGSPVCIDLFAPVKQDEHPQPCGCVVCRLFGDLHPVDGGGEVRAEASRVWVSSAYPLCSEAPVIRDSLAIERASGTSDAASGAKFDRQLLPGGAVFSFRLAFDLEKPPDGDGEMLLSAVLAEWQAGRGRLGARRGSGLGEFVLEELKYRSLDLSVPNQLLKYLQSDAPWQDASASDWPVRRIVGAFEKKRPFAEVQKLVGDDHLLLRAVHQNRVEFTFKLVFPGPMLINDAAVALMLGSDHAPLQKTYPLAVLNKGQAVLPGTAIRGVLRGYAEKLARTLATILASAPNKPDEEFLKRCPTCAPTQSNPEKALASCDSLLKAAEISTRPRFEATDEHLCLSCRLFGSPQRSGRLWVSEANLADSAHVQKPLLQDFLALDRFTGGGKDGAKFDTLALVGACFSARLVLENPQPWELGWLALVLRDLQQDGWLSFGWGKAKGYGRAQAQDVQLLFQGLDSADLAGLGVSIPDDPNGLWCQKTISFADLADLTKPWIDEFQTKVKTFERVGTAKKQQDGMAAVNDHLPILENDHYFTKSDTLISKLYPVQVSMKPEAPDEHELR